MQHPFDGLINDNDAPAPSRRQVLGTAVGGYAALMGLAAARGEDKIDPIVPSAGDYGRYLVVPKDFRGFKAADRKKLGVHGGYFRSAKSKAGPKQRAGFLAWLTPRQAESLAAEAAVAEVSPISGADIPGPGKKPPKAQQAVVMLAPNGWKGTTPGSYVSTDDLVKQWAESLGKMAKVKVTRGKSESMVLLNLDGKGMPENVVAALKSHPQVVGVMWNGVATTLALGEEGASTKALGEEGGRPRPTTLALGEEGATTKAIGEEGGRPRPQPTTLALGEEGGPRPSTRALGEEGGRPPVKRPAAK